MKNILFASVLMTMICLSPAIAGTKPKITIVCRRSPQVVCVTIAGHGAMGQVIMHGPAEFTSTLYDPPAPSCSSSETPWTSAFAHTSDTDSDVGIGFINGVVCVSGDQQTVTMYGEDSPTYASYATWYATLP